MPEVIPAVNDSFWFEQSKAYVSAALDARDLAAAKLQTFSVWLWGIYTGATAVGFNLSKQDLTATEITVITVGSCLLIITYFLAIWVQVPVLKSFDPRSPTLIIAFYSKKLQIKQRRLLVTTFVGVLSLLASSIGILTAALANSSRFPEISTTFSHQGTNELVFVCCRVKSKSDIDLSVDTGRDIFKAKIRPSEERACNTFRVNQASNIMVSVLWVDEVGITNSFGKSFLNRSK